MLQFLPIQSANSYIEMLSILDDPQFRHDFAQGMADYQAECVSVERPLTDWEACDLIRDDLECRAFGTAFLAGWLHAHLAMNATAVSPDPQPTMRVSMPAGPLGQGQPLVSDPMTGCGSFPQRTSEEAEAHAPQVLDPYDQVRERVNIVMSLPARSCGIDGWPLDL